MQFSNTSTKAGIIQNIESLCGLGDGGITNNTTLFAKITGYVNESYKRVALALIMTDKRWQWDDSNYSDFPRAAITLVNGQKDYTLPAATTSGDFSTLYGIVKIAVLDKNSTPQEIILSPTTDSEADLNNQWATSGMPAYYKLIGNSIKMWPAPDNNVTVTLTNGLIVYFKRGPVPYTTASTTVEPGFIAACHDILEYEAAAKHLMPQNQVLATTYLQLAANQLDKLLDAKSHENEDIPTRITMINRSSR